MVRMFNFDTEDNYVLPLELAEATGNISRVVCLACDNRCATAAQHVISNGFAGSTFLKLQM